MCRQTVSVTSFASSRVAGVVAMLLAVLFAAARANAVDLHIFPNNPVLGPGGEAPYRPASVPLPAAGNGTNFTKAQAEAVLRAAMDEANAAAAPGVQFRIFLHTFVDGTTPTGLFEYCVTHPVNDPPIGDAIADETGLPVLRSPIGLPDNVPDVVIQGVLPIGIINNKVTIRRASPDGILFRLIGITRNARLELNNVRLADGQVPGEGGAVVASGVISDDPAVRSVDLQLDLINCEFINNRAGTRGGAVSVANLPPPPGVATGFSLVVQDCLFQNNAAQTFGGGGAYVERTKTQFLGTEFRENFVGIRTAPDTVARAGLGGGIHFNNGASGGSGGSIVFDLQPSPTRPMLFVSNQAQSAGGAYLNGITNRDGDVVLSTVRVEANFFNNAADEQGGGMFINEGDHLVFRCNFGNPNVTGRGNTAREGAGAYIRGFTGRVIRCNFDENIANRLGTGSGGGVFLDSKSERVSFEECCFTQNEAFVDGGGAKTRGTSVPFFDDCVFSYNVAQDGGGLANGDQGLGGAPNSVIYNCVFTHNVGTRFGGGIYIARSQPTILHTTIAGNRAVRFVGGGAPAANAGTGVHLNNGIPNQAAVTILNSIIFGNARGAATSNGSFGFTGALPVLNTFSFPKVRFSIVDDTQYAATFPTPPEDSPAVVAQVGPSFASNINLNPRFVNLAGDTDLNTLPDGNVHLTCPSPAIDRASFQRARALLREVGLAGNLPGVSPTSPSFETDVDAFVGDYDDSVENPLGVEPCPAPNCTTPYVGGEAIQPRTCRATQCQSDMGADESRNEYIVTPLPDKVVCINGRQTFSVDVMCPTNSVCDLGTGPALFTIQWCRVRFDPTQPVGSQCVETPLTNGNGITISADQKTITIDLAARSDDLDFNSFIRAKITRGGPGLIVPLPAGQPCDPAFGCPPACVQGRLYVVPAPTVATTGDKTVCRNGNQCLQYNISWTDLPKDPIAINCPCPGDLDATPRVPPPSCIPTLSYSYQRTVGGPITSFTGNARATITCDPDTSVPDPTVAGALRITRVCRICFVDALDGSTAADQCDAGRYCAKITCGLEAGKCADAEACANLCVVPTPMPGGDLKNVVCIGGSQTIVLNGMFPSPTACALPWCPTSPCVPVVSISRLKTAPGAVEENLFTFPNAQNLTTVTIGNTVVTCQAFNPTTRKINCTVGITAATQGDCARYRITTDCSNLVPDDKCRAQFWDSVLCVLPPITGNGDPTKNVCLGGTQTACLYLEYPTPNCIYCLPPYFSTDTMPAPCTPAAPPVFKRITPGGPTITIPLVALTDGTGRFRATRNDVPVGGTGQATSTTTITCEPFNTTTRRTNCCVEVRNANDANCAIYRIEGSCSNLPTTDKCLGIAETQICVARPPTTTVDPDQFVCIDGNQTINLRATFPPQPCVHCGPLTPQTMVVFRPTGGAEVMVPCIAQPNGTCTGTLGHASVVCQPFNTTTRNVDCVVTVTSASLADCGEYCIKADYAGVTADKCPAVIGCTKLCVVPKPIASGDPDKTVCFGKNQTLNFKATYPRGSCLVTTACPTACTPAASLFKRDAAGTVTPLVTGSGTTVTCDPVTTLPNGDREINCRVVVTNADTGDCLDYFIRASCANLTAGQKCAPVEWHAKLCVIRNPIVSIEPQRYVCVGGNQTVTATINFPAQDCFYCPTDACVGSYEFVRRPNTSCTAPSTGGVPIPIVLTGQTPPASGAYVTCTPTPDGRTQNCTIFIRNAVDAGGPAPDCGAYYVRAKACPNLATDKCDYVEACGQICVIPAPDATGDAAKCVCINGNQTFTFRGFFPTPGCVSCPTTPAPCTPFVTLVRKLPGPGGVEQPLYVSSGSQPPAQPRVTATCTPLAAVTGGREYSCTVTITGAQAEDCAQYCLRASCNNLDTGKCATDEWCANLCVLPNPTSGGDTSKTVCVKGTQTIDLFAEFPEGTCGFCTLPGVNCCTPTWAIKRRVPNGSGGFTETTLNIGGSRTDSQTFPSLPPDPPAGPETVVATTSVTCDPIGPGPTRRVNCRVTITNANDLTCGEYCIDASCSNFPATGAGADKCRTSRWCARLCVLRPPSVTSPAEVCVCVGGCQTIPFTVNFPAPACSVAGCDATTCTRVINVYKLNAAGQRLCALSSGPGVDQYVCDPPVNGVQNCRIKVGGGSCGPGQGVGGGTACPGATLGEDNFQYCVEVTCGGLAEGKCLTDRACTRLRVYERPCPTDISDQKICQRDQLCVSFSYTAPPCCQASLTITKDGVPITTSPTGRYRLTTLPNGARQFCIVAPAGQLLNDTDDGVYRVTVACPNLTAEKNCECYDEFCVDVLSPPTVTVTPPVQTVCQDQDADFYICPTGDVMRCPMAGVPGPTPMPLSVLVQKVTGRPTGNSCQLPTGETASPVSSNVTVTPDPTAACPGRYRVHFENVDDDDCGYYRVTISYDVTTPGFDPDNRCITCTYFELRCGTVNVCLRIPPVCPDEPLKICPRFANCEPDPYQIPGGLVCDEYPCFSFKWYFTPSNPAGPEVELVGQTSCCLMFPSAGPQHEGCYRLVVTPLTSTDPANPCFNQPPCDPVEVRACFTLRPPEECCWCVDCCWDNGRRETGPTADGVLSMKPAHGEFPEIKAAADFFLCEGQFHRIKKFAGAMLIRQNPNLPYKAKLTLYEDCDGSPGAMIDMWDLTEYCLVETPDPTGLQKIDFVKEFTEADKLWLRGGKTYWWSLQGISDLNTFNYEAYWVSSRLGHVVGGVPKKMEVGVEEGWSSLDCCIACIDLAFCIECEMCKIIYDGGVPEECESAGGSRSEKSASPTRNSRAADNFVTPPVIKMPDPSRPECDFLAVDWMVCYVEGYIYTNCNSQTFKSYLEIYGNNCDDPSWVLVGDPPYRFRADKIDPVEPACYATIDGVSNLRLYKVRFCPMGSATYPQGLYLRGGRNYWASISVEDTFNQSQRAYFAWNSDDCNPCPIQFGPGKEISPGARNIIRWTSVGHDFAFTIAAKNVPFDLTVPNVPVIDPATACASDINGDGRVTVQDMFDFLVSWFAGCP